MIGKGRYLQLGKWRVSKWFVTLTIAVLFWSACDLYRLATDIPLSTTLPPALPPRSGLENSYSSDVVGDVYLCVIATTQGPTQNIYWCPEASGARLGELNFYKCFSTGPLDGEPRTDKKKQYEFGFILEGAPYPIVDIQFHADTGWGKVSPSYPVTFEKQTVQTNDQRTVRSIIPVQSTALFPEKDKYGVVSLGVAVDKGGVLIAETPLPGRVVPQRGMEFSIEEDSHGRIFAALVTLPKLPTDAQGRPLYFCKVYAVDWLGRMHPSDKIWPVQPTYYWTELSPLTVRSIRLIAYPYQWFTFEDQVLHPQLFQVW